MSTLIQDLRFGVRMLIKYRSVTLVAVITLALGIGANTTMFTVVNATLLRPLPFPEPDQLVQLDETAPKRDLVTMQLSLPDFIDWRDQSRSFEAMGLYEETSFTLSSAQSTDVRAERTDGANVTASLFPTLGINPIRGRHFLAEEDGPKAASVVMIGYGPWLRRFGGDPNIVGQTVKIDGANATVVGIMPPDFKFPLTAEVWRPITRANVEEERGHHFAYGIGRLRRGATIEQARAELQTIAGRIWQAHPRSNADVEAVVKPFREAIVGDMNEVLWLLLAVVGFVLLIACANVANLMLARGAARSREMGIRTALGAGRFRLARQLFAESLLLSFAGGALGILVAMWSADWLMAAIPEALPTWIKFTLDWRVLGFTFSATLLTAILFGLLPAWQSSRADLNSVLKEGGRGGAGASGRLRLRSLLVVSELALALLLLIGAGLLMKSLVRLRQVNPGFKAESVLTAKIALPEAQYRDAAQRTRFYQQVRERLASSPGIEAIGLTSSLPLSNEYTGNGFTVEGHPQPLKSVNSEAIPILNYSLVSPGYFRTMGMILIKGRDLNDDDVGGKTTAIVIDETLARQYFQDEDALGKRIKFGGPSSDAPWRTIVGVVNAVRHWGLKEEIRPTAYLPNLGDSRGAMVIVARSQGNPVNLSATLRNEVAALDKDLPLYGVRPMTAVVALAMWEEKYYSVLFTLFAILALTLAAVGIFGVMSYTVTQRTHEIGVRMALGAQQGDVLRLIIRQGMSLVAIGLAIGLVAAFALTRVMESMLFAVKATDPTTFVVISLLLTAVALVACYIPARRATKVDPLVALRYQ